MPAAKRTVEYITGFMASTTQHLHDRPSSSACHLFRTDFKERWCVSERLDMKWRGDWNCGMEFQKCVCPHCEQSIEYPAEGKGETIACPTCKKFFALWPANPNKRPGTILIPPVGEDEKTKEGEAVSINVTRLEEERARARPRKGDTTAHVAARSGTFDKIGMHPLKIEEFLAYSAPRKLDRWFRW